MTTMRMRKYRIVVEEPSSLTDKDFKRVLVTVNRGLYGTEFSELRADVNSLDSIFEEVNDESRSLLMKLVEQFNLLETRKLNKRLLDNASLPMEPEPTPDPTPTDDTRPPTWFSSYTEHFGAADENGNPTRAASIVQVDQLARELDNLRERVEKLEAIKPSSKPTKKKAATGGSSLKDKADKATDKLSNLFRENQFSPKQRERRKANTNEKGGEQ